MTNNSIAVQEFQLPDRQTTQSKLDEIREFQTLVKSQLIEGHDYGTIPGTQKPTLFQPGAEKIIKLMGLADTYEIIGEMKDWDKGIFSYTVRCSLLWQGEIIVSQGLGECNTMEEKYRWRWIWPNELSEHGYSEDQKGSLRRKEFTSKKNGRKYVQYRIENEDPYTLVNTALKMSVKRSKVAAALSAGRLSDIFTQDMEDTKGDDYEPQMISEDPESMKQPEPTPASSFDPKNPQFANKGEFMKQAKDRLGLVQKDVLGYLGVEKTGDLEDDSLVNYWKQLEVINVIPPAAL